jgi:hypothetical protein
VLVDGFRYTHRKFTAFPLANSSRGMPTKPLYNKDAAKVSFGEGVVYLVGGIFVLYLSNGGLVEIGIICIVWFLSLNSRKKKKKLKKKRGSESDTTDDDDED